MTQRRQLLAWGVGLAAVVAGLAAMTARNAGRALDGQGGERPGARKAVMQQVLEASLPYRLAGLERRQLLSGAEALAEINRLHGQELPLTGGRVARYGEAPGIAVWTGQASSAAAAGDMVRTMEQAMAGGHTPFRLRPELSAQAIRASGLGQEHAFYASGTQVVWVAAPDSAMATALEELREYLPF